MILARGGGAEPDAGLSPAGRALVVFWAVIVAGAATGAGVLQWLGPPTAAPQARAPDLREADAPAPVESAPKPVTYGPPVPEAPRQATPMPPVPPKPGQPIQAPLPALMEAAAGAPAGLPRIGADGRAPMLAYSAGVDPADTRPRVAILFGGLGPAEADSIEALKALPPAVSFVVSAYTAKPDHLLAELRAYAHEYLLGLPMEPQNYPMDDPGTQALLVGAPPAQNVRRLDWALSRFAGYAGVTNAADGMRGERFASSPLMDAVLQTIARRGLLYIDSAPARAVGGPPGLAARAIDLVLDEPSVRSEIDTKLARLEQLAREHGSALGLATLPRPVTIDRIAAWATQLSERGIALVPASALVSVAPLTPTGGRGH